MEISLILEDIEQLIGTFEKNDKQLCNYVLTQSVITYIFNLILEQVYLYVITGLNICIACTMLIRLTPFIPVFEISISQSLFEY